MPQRPYSLRCARRSRFDDDGIRNHPRAAYQVKSRRCCNSETLCRKLRECRSLPHIRARSASPTTRRRTRRHLCRARRSILELNNAKATLDAVLTNLKRIQRDDGSVANASIGLDQLKAEVPVGFNAPVAWTTGTVFTAGSSTVFQGSGFYRCLVTHTSSVFATDLAAGKWQLIVNLAAVPARERQSDRGHTLRCAHE